jgi:hypothetical protein
MKKKLMFQSKRGLKHLSASCHPRMQCGYSYRPCGIALPLKKTGRQCEQAAAAPRNDGKSLTSSVTAALARDTQPHSTAGVTCGVPVRCTYGTAAPAPECTHQKRRAAGPIPADFRPPTLLADAQRRGYIYGHPGVPHTDIKQVPGCRASHSPIQGHSLA